MENDSSVQLILAPNRLSGRLVQDRVAIKSELRLDGEHPHTALVSSAEACLRRSGGSDERLMEVLLQGNRCRSGGRRGVAHLTPDHDRGERKIVLFERGAHGVLMRLVDQHL
jgi:hypothetical protein